jgi:ABC-type branched-subunit amino acid transport system substrate-binding protein
MNLALINFKPHYLFLALTIFHCHVCFADNIKLGIILPLTGPIAEYGVASRNGFELARKEHRDQFSEIEFVYEDSQYDPKLSISAYQKLRRDPDVKIIYSWGSNPTAPLISIAEKDCFPLFADSSSNTFNDISCVIAFAPTSIILGKRLIEYIGKKNFRKLGIVSVENLYMNGIIDGIKNNLNSEQEIVFHETVLSTDSDFKSNIAKLKSKDIDALGVMLYPGQISNFFRNLQTIGYSKPTFGSDIMESRAEIKSSGSLIQGSFYPHKKISEAAYEKYMKVYKDDSQVTNSGSAYDFAMMMLSLFKKEPKFYKDHLAHVNSLHGYEGVMGAYTFEKTKEFGKRLYPPIYIKKIQNDFFEVIE